jgi:DNA polymerase-1
MAETFYIIDGHAHIYRAYYAPFRELTSPGGEPTRATFVFCQMLFNLIRAKKPDYLAMVADVSDKTVFRCEIDPAYKANRQPPPEDLPVQADRIMSIVQALGIPVYRKEGFEADDLMATMAGECAEKDLKVFLVSGDKDLHQLLSDRVALYDPAKDVVLDPSALDKKHGYGPYQALEIQALTGDSTDNVPGVPGVGLKTAVKLIGQYGTAEAVIEHADELTPKLRERVKAYADQLPVTRRLLTLRKDVPFEWSLEACRLDRVNVEAVRPVFDELGFDRLREALDELDDGEASEKVEGAPKRVSGAQRDYYLVDTPGKLEELVERLSACEAFAFDTETTGLNPVDSELVGLSFSWNAGTGYYVPVRGTMGSVLPVDTVVEKLGSILEDESKPKVGQNVKYDLIVLRQVGIRVRGVVFDTMIAAFLLDPDRRSKSLDYLARTLFGHEMIPITDLIGKGKNQSSMDQVSTERVCEYASEDADFTWRLYQDFKPQIDGSHLESLFYGTEMPLIEVLAEMEHNGIALDADLLKRLSDSMADKLVALSQQVQEAAGHEFNVDSPKQLATVLFDEQKLPVIRKTKTGRSTDADTLEALAGRMDNPIPKLILEYRELFKLRNTYLDTLPNMVCRRTGRIHASFNQTGAVTGRLSSSDPNLQNIPVRTETGRRIREAFVAQDDDTVLLVADYSQIELRLLAHFCKDRALLQAFHEGRDIHATVAAQVNGVPLEEVTPEQRSAAKAVNFGIIYGQSAFGLSRQINVPVGEAQAFINAYFMRYPGIRMFIDKCIDDAKANGYAETILGRRRPIPELHSRNRQQRSFGERIAVNTVVQGSAADLIKRAMIDIHRELLTGEHSAKMLIQVHDELVFEVPEDDLDRETEMIRKKMEHAITLDVPIVVDINWGRNWAEGK